MGKIKENTPQKKKPQKNPTKTPKTPKKTPQHQNQTGLKPPNVSIYFEKTLCKHVFIDNRIRNLESCMV